MTAQAVSQVGKQSRIGKRPIPVPKGVTINVAGEKVDVQGPKGKLSRQLPPSIVVQRDGDVLRIQSSAAERDAARLQGLGRQLVAAMVKGVSEGYERILELVGTGYRAEVRGKSVHMSLGLSHPAVVELPTSVSAVVPPDSKGTQIVLTSADKAVVGQLAATIRSLRPPEPYGGKGVRYRGEVIRKKAGKAGKGRTK